MTTMLERCARAICLSLSFSPDDRLEFDEEPIVIFRWEAYVTAARAVLEALYEPDYQMIRTAIGPMKADDEEQAGRVWQAMLSHILDET